MKVSKRFKAIQDFLNVSDQFIDIGSDHAYVPILMAQRGSKKILATDIHAGALKIARKNIMDAGSEDVIQTQLADGLSGVVTEGYDTLVIAGMGYFTIEHILKDQEKLKPIKKNDSSIEQSFKGSTFTFKQVRLCFERRISRV